MSASDDIVLVRSIMSDGVKTIKRMASVADAIAVMREERVSSLVVPSKDMHDEFGVLTVRDIARDVVAAGKAVDRVNVYEIMSKPVLTIPEDMSIKNAVRLLVRFGLTRGVVVDQDRKPIGMATLRDMVLGYK